jgi:hypothetical protein
VLGTTVLALIATNRNESQEDNPVTQGRPVKVLGESIDTPFSNPKNALAVAV